MSAAVVVAILVAAGEAHAPATVATQAAAAEALGPGGSVVVQETPSLSDGEGLRVQEQSRAAAIVQVSWANPSKASVRVRMHVGRSDRWIDREISFLPADTLVERGRTIGFAIASMLLSETEASAPASAAPTVAPKPDPRPVPIPVAVATERSAHQTTREPAREPEPLPRAVDLRAVGARGVNGPAGGLGAAASFELCFAPGLWLRAGGGIRSGAVPRLNGDDVVVSAAIGVAWRRVPATAAGRFGGGIRLDAGVLFHDLSHRVADGTIARQGRLIPGATLAAEAIWRATGSLDAVLAIGPEIAFGTTEVLVAGHPIATIPVFRGLVELGARIRF